ncbi:hypothetical protein D6D24_10681, partial [Aureobasidium pullulans]
TLPELSPSPSCNDLPLQEIRLELARTIHLPIAIPQASNLFGVKHLSPFARCYPPALDSIQTPISQQVFLDFLDDLNGVFVAHPGFLAIGSSPMMSFLRVRRYMQQANQELFEPRGLRAKILTTKKMVRLIGLGATDEKGRLVLCEPDEVESSRGVADSRKNCEEKLRERLLRSLDGYVSPLSFDMSDQAVPNNTLERVLNTPSSSIDKVLMRKPSTSRKRILDSTINATIEYDARILDLGKKIQECRTRISSKSLNIDSDTKSAKEHIEVHDLRARLMGLEVEMALEKQLRNNHLREVRIAHAKTFMEVDRDENKVANRILWLVIDQA